MTKPWGKIEQTVNKYSPTIVSRDTNPIRFPSNLKLISYAITAQYTHAYIKMKLKKKKTSLTLNTCIYTWPRNHCFPYRTVSILYYVYIRGGCLVYNVKIYIIIIAYTYVCIGSLLTVYEHMCALREYLHINPVDWFLAIISQRSLVYTYMIEKLRAS